ncbi:MAG: hypothetical protein ABS45_12390 [Comamonas sp. SCN 65-56]|uniref:hypothetical protein n=1 Tax=Comamonas sp. SCN 65-56 TaxID=1660095 RepID=UPI00086E1524|nr:hypothetical protein [Comamonas sp. SCN 65-56]ODS91230.1 MAG: hypothetical protein ABS45_12390 [Comamonas sp. SCN 65-56]
MIRLPATLVAAVLAALSTSGAWASCYVVYGPNQQVVYRNQTPPVDMSRQVHETLPLVAPGGTLVFSLDNFGCELPVNKLPLKVTATARKARQPARERLISGS